ncbi:hypothetical protein KC19_11G106100 [Ceratodon purpureus]|uniref:GRF-type domain-containing protein n=1 Tax=Ceratodon purpureus TaxID=3225 RepID=A0A8T0GDP8_CERPU|nr:hypothetical protein KC19_11G106100 [Ceratodon purpureus]
MMEGAGGLKERMETEEVMPGAGNAGDDLGASEPLNIAGGGRNGILDTGPVGGSEVEYKEKTVVAEEGVLEASQIAAVGLGATEGVVLESGDERKEEAGLLVRSTAGSTEAVLALEQMPSGGISTAVQDTLVSDTKNPEIETRHEAHGGLIACENVTDSAMKPVAVEAATDVSSPVKEDAIVLTETQPLQMDYPAELSTRLDTKVNGCESANPNSTEIANGKEAQESLLSSRVLAQKTETIKNRDGTMKSLEISTVNQDSRKDTDRHRITNSIAEVVAAGVAAGVAEGIAESIAETIAKETAGASGQGSMEGRVFDSGRFERMAIAKAVAEVIAESVAQEVAQGLADGLAEAAATGEVFSGVGLKKPDNIQGMTEANKDGVLCDCELVAVVRVVGEKSPNRGLRYLMCPRQDPSFFKRKGKRKDSDTIGKCKFFRWLDTPRHTSKEDKKNHEKDKTNPEELNAPIPTRSSAKESNLESPSGAGNLSADERGDVSPPEIPTSRNTEDTSLLPEGLESTPDLKVKPARKQRKKGLAEESGKDDILDANRPASAGTLTRSALRKGAPEPAQEPSLDTSAVSTPLSTLGKRAIDWTDSYIGPESQVVEKSQGVSFRKRRSVRGESGPSSRYSLGGSGSGRSTGFGSSEKKPLHYFRRSTGQVGAIDGDPINLDSSNPLADVESLGAGQKDETDNRFKSYYKKGKGGRSLEPKSKIETIGDKLQLGPGKSRVNRVVEEVSLVEPEKKTKPQTRRQQRKLPLSEVYGAMEPLVPAKMASKKTNTLVGTDHSLSPSSQSLGKNTPSDVASEPKEVGHATSPPKKRKLSWVLSEDSVMQEADTPKRSSARKGNSVNSGGQNSLFSMVETPLLASAFPTVRYEAKLPAEDYHDPDDPWSLEIPWAKQEHEEEKAQQVEKAKETFKDERDEEAMEAEDCDVKMHVEERIEAVSEAAAAGEELPLAVPEPVEVAGFESSGNICEPVFSDNTLIAGGGKNSGISGSPMDQKTTSTSLTDGQEMSDVLKKNHVDIENEVSMMPDETVEVASISASEEELPNSNTLISGNLNSSVDSKSYTGDTIKPESTHLGQDQDVQRSDDFAELPLDNASLLSTPDVCGSLVRNDQVLENVQELLPEGTNDSKVPEEAGVILQGQQMSVLPDEQSTGDKTQTSTLAAETGAEVGADEHASVISKSASMKVGEATTETDSILHHESSEPYALNDAAVTNERELVVSGDEHEIHDLQGDVEGIDEPIEEPAISGSNLMAVGAADGRVDQVNNHEPEKDVTHASLDQDTGLKSPREADNAGAAAASENAGFVNSVWRSASGKKTRSVGSIGAPAVTSKRSRSVVPTQKGGPKGGPRRQAEVQWVDVPLDWRNEKSTGRAPLLPNFSRKGLNGSDTTQSEMRLLQSADTSQGTHSAHPRIRRGEVDDSSIITEEKEKGHDGCNDSTDYNAQITNVAAPARQATLGSAAMEFEASVPGGEHGVVGGPTNQRAVVAEGDNVAQRRKRGRPRKDSKKSDEFQYSIADGLKSDAAGGANQTPEPELAGVVGKADGEPSSMILCSTTIEGNTTTELHGEDRVSQLERSASNTERENGKREGVSSEPDECGISLDGSDVPSASLEGLQSEIDAPHCLCKVVPRQAVLKTVVRSGDPNQGLRYWSCSNYRKLFTKKKKPPSDVTEESCNYFRWLDTPRVTAKDKREARKERYRQVELQRLL